MPNPSLSTALQSIEDILAQHDGLTFKDVLANIDSILDTYQSSSTDNGAYQDIVQNIDDILVTYQDKPLEQTNSADVYQDVLQDIDQIIAQYDDLEDVDLKLDANANPEDSLNIPDNTNVSKLTKFSRLNGDEQNSAELPTDEFGESDVTEDPDKQGMIRTVPGAHLVYKRQKEDNTFEELWVYNLSQMKTDVQIRHAILAGTAITTANTTSPDGTQQYELCTMGNAECMKIKGLTE